MEVAVAGVLLATLMTVCLQLFKATAAQRRALQDRHAAIRETVNLMERLSVYPWDELTPKNVAVLEISDESRQSLAEARLEIDVTRTPDEPEAKRITVTLQWQNHSGRPERPVRLVAWRYRTEDGQ